MAQPLDKISVFNTGPSKNDLAIERLQKDMAGLRGQMDLVSLQHSAIKQDQAQISKHVDAFEERTNADKKIQDEYDEDKMERLMRIEAVLWPYKRQKDGWDVQDLEPLLDRVTRMDKVLADVVLKRDLQLEMQEMDDNYSQCKTIVKEVGGQNDENTRGIADLDARVENIFNQLQDLKHDMAVTPVKTPFLYTPYQPEVSTTPGSSRASNPPAGGQPQPRRA
jgi:chromosome segregation ATPase